ncbi:MAG: Gfo/Idh/MocA family oxidoreductase [Alphaproteobacteria bacterium]|nr:Gfo/Idh/MocA family oxidoreductase [Alphaproteobacteria bacterium]MBU0797907.1 Gfo/Idh/MocA family oxidoreductase [Alphaproteobacteria bacterium]MBU0886141.1 Gfo/Idh/MocA family oxidoreductase [Alphaproteobacteria bacterium]MBU1812781.1 Gfo/Idh/MocA family oxidoreductase [Alphaproteobacteria bacterium]
MRILLIGAGRIAGEYAKALNARGGVTVEVLSRSAASAEALARTHGLAAAHHGGMDRLAELDLDYDGIIVATPIETLLPYLEHLTGRGARRVLVEKPLCLSSNDLRDFLARHPGAPAMVALNRLYYPSVTALAEILRVEPAILAEFTFGEMVERTLSAGLSPAVLARLGVANSIHVIATAFDLIGLPRTLDSCIEGQGRLDWHPAGAIFTGTGLSETGVPFTYAADWLAGGRWSMAVRTARGLYRMAPMEGLAFVPEDGGPEEMLVVPPSPGGLKPGFPEMLAAWLDATAPDPRAGLPRLLAHMQAIERIMGYADLG